MMHAYSATAARPLADTLAAVLAEHPLDPMEPEWLAVPSEGMRRWLSLELARRLGSSGEGSADGVTANFVRAFPGDARNALLAAARPDGDPDPWQIERMVWAVLKVLQAESASGRLPGFGLVPGGPPTYATARRITDLFDRYHLHRPSMIRNWAAQHDVDPAGRDLSEHAVWQARLWRRVREEIGLASPPEVLPAVLARLRSGEDLCDLPSRVVLFGFSLLPAGDFLEVVGSLAVQRDVHLFLLEPTRLDPDALVRSSPYPAGGTRLRSGDPASGLADHPLVRSWGRLHRETALLLADARADGLVVESVGTEPVTLPTEAQPPEETLLGRVQHDIRTNTTPRPDLIPDASDQSIQFHSCFGATRQVEVVRDAILHLLADPASDIAEEEIVVLCPSLDRFAPLIEAVFGRSAEPDGPTSADIDGGSPEMGRGTPALRFRVADQSITAANPFAAAVLALLDLVVGRFDVTSVLDFLAADPVRERFGFDDDTLAVVTQWMAETNVRWGLDPDHRSGLGLPSSVISNTWRAALDRLLVGSTIYDEGLCLAVGGIAPLGVEGGDVVTAGRVATALGHLAELADLVETARPIDEWVGAIRQACDGLFATRRGTVWQREAMERVLAAVVEAATQAAAPSGVDLTVADVRKLLAERLDDRVGRADFFRGGVTVTSLTPLRWVPFRAVCLLGMDQAAFAAEGSAGDDLAAAQPQIGDRDVRGESRELLLEAVLAAEERLIVVRDGRDVRTNQVIPRAVATAELFEAVLASVMPGWRDVVAERLEVDHPRQSFDERCFERDGLVAGMPWGFDGDDLKGALSRRRRAERRTPFLSAPLVPIHRGPAEDRPGSGGGSVIDLADLHAFFINPVAAFFSQRLQVRIPRAEDEVAAVVPVDVGGLAGWRIGTRLLQARMSGSTTQQWLRHERALGTLPPGSLGREAVDALSATVDALLDEARGLGARAGTSRPLAVDAHLADGTRVVGAVPLGLPAGSPGPARIHYSRFKATHRVAAWLDLMALAVSDPETPWRSLAVSRSLRPGGDPEVNDLVVRRDTGEGGAVLPTDALAVAVDCYRRGMTEPIPLFPDFSYQLYRAKDYAGNWNGYSFPADGDHPAVRLAFDEADYDQITSIEARPTDPRAPKKDRASRFAIYLYRTIVQSTTSFAPAEARR